MKWFLISSKALEIETISRKTPSKMVQPFETPWNDSQFILWMFSALELYVEHGWTFPARTQQTDLVNWFSISRDDREIHSTDTVLDVVLIVV